MKLAAPVENLLPPDVRVAAVAVLQQLVVLALGDLLLQVLVVLQVSIVLVLEHDLFAAYRAARHRLHLACSLLRRRCHYLLLHRYIHASHLDAFLHCLVQLGRLFGFDDIYGLVQVLGVVLFGFGEEDIGDALQIGYEEVYFELEPFPEGLVVEGGGELVKAAADFLFDLILVGLFELFELFVVVVLQVYVLLLYQVILLDQLLVLLEQLLVFFTLLLQQSPQLAHCRHQLLPRRYF